MGDLLFLGTKNEALRFDILRQLEARSFYDTPRHGAWKHYGVERALVSRLFTSSNEYMECSRSKISSPK